ncbi:MAG: hypothetical protein LBQ54_16360 [Planctomycetaceae bacterium]|jgi:hypothetical protein|nr:hypothetical protein [Planctomycetaceae bacterium]
MTIFYILLLFLFLSGTESLFADNITITAKNIAPAANVSANSEYSTQYSAQFVIDGVIPDAGNSADMNHSWCVRNETAKNHGELTLQWGHPVDVAEIVYWGRTSFFVSECWKDYQVFIDDQVTPVAVGTFQMKHGPQQIVVPKQKAQTLKIVFQNAYGGPNPGAAEIMVFSEPLTTKEAKELKKLSGNSVPDSLAECDAETQKYLSNGLNRFLVIKRFEIKASHVYTYHYEGFRAGGGLYVFDCEELKKNPDAKGTLLVPATEGQILDADLSHDGRTVLFSWRKKQSEPYHLWSVNVDGSELKQLTDGPWHDYNACWLPDGDIAFLTSRSPQFAYCWNAPVGILHRMKPDGSRLIQISGNYLNDFTPSVLDDGRIIYSRWEYVDKPAIPIQSLWAIHPDGTNLQVVFGNRTLSPATFMEARQIPGTSQLVCTMTGHNGPTRGAIGILDRRFGVNSQESVRNITPEIPVDPVDQGDGNRWAKQIYSSPFPLDTERFLVSAQGPLLIRTFELVPETQRPVAEAVLLPAPEDGMQYFNALPIRSRPVPPRIPDQFQADQETKPAYAVIAMQDVYEGLGPDVKRGEVAAIRIVREMQKTVRIEPHLRSFGFQFPVISCGATYAGKMILGDVPVANDGSAYFKVGAGATRLADGYGDGTANSVSNETFTSLSKEMPQIVPTTGPIYFIALDNEGRAIQRMRSFTHLMPGEQQACVGCHDSRTSAPLRPDRLAEMATREPIDPVLPDWADARHLTPERAAFSPGFDYVRTVQPVWDRYCIECHNPKDAPKGIDLSGGFTDYFNVSYDVLASENQGQKGSPYISWIPTYNGDEQNILKIAPKEWGSYQSPLAELIRNGHPDEQGKKRFEMEEESRRKVFAWIDLNVPYYASSETSHPDALGCRRIYPPTLDTVLNEVAARRCVQCHSKGNVSRRNWVRRTQNQVQYPEENTEGTVPRRSWTRITEPELNPFLLAPLAKSAGGTERCGIIFPDKNDSDYRKILETFEPVLKSITKQPRIDMPDGKPAPDVCRLTE